MSDDAKDRPDTFQAPEGYRLATMGEAATHAVCRKHGRVVPIDTDDHPCGWIKLVELREGNSKPFESPEVRERREREVVMAAAYKAVQSGRAPLVLTEIFHERVRQQAKWGEQNHPSYDPYTAPEVRCRRHGLTDAETAKDIVECLSASDKLTWTDTLVEELAEAVEAESPADVRAELVQVAAVAVAWIECIDRAAAVAARGGGKTEMNNPELEGDDGTA